MHFSWAARAVINNTPRVHLFRDQHGLGVRYSYLQCSCGLAAKIILTLCILLNNDYHLKVTFIAVRAKIVLKSRENHVFLSQFLASLQILKKRIFFPSFMFNGKVNDTYQVEVCCIFYGPINIHRGQLR